MKSRLTSKEKAVLELIENDKVAEDYFFKKVSNPKWFPYLKEKGFFSPEKAPGPKPADKEGFYTIPYWNVLDYLERISQKVNEPDKEIYIDELLEIIKKVTEYHKKTNAIDNYRTWSSFIRIVSNLPNEKITDVIINLIPIWLNSDFGSTVQVMEIVNKLIPKFLRMNSNDNDIKKAEKIIENILQIEKLREKENAKSGIYTYWLRKFFEKNLDIIAIKCSNNLIDTLRERLKELISSEYDGTLYSLYDYKEEAKYLLEKPIELITYVLSNILVKKFEKKPDNVKQVLKSFFKEHYPIFTKIALFVIGKKMNISLSREIFWQVLKTKGDEIFRGSIIYWGDELKNILNKLDSLNAEQKKLLEDKIKSAAKIYRDTFKEDDNKEVRVDAFKQRFYKALSHDSKFKSLYKKIKEKGIDAELLPAIQLTEVRTGWGKSPLELEEILQKNNKELVEFLETFKTEDPWDGPTVDALAETLKTAVKTNPQKFTTDLEVFMNIGYLYVAKIFDGFQEALRDKKIIDYKKIFDFIGDYIDRNEFWQDKLKVQTSSLPNTHFWVISSFSFFLTESLKNSENQLPENLFEKVVSILHKILDNLEAKTDESILDYTHYSINSPLGRIIETYIRFIIHVFQSSYDSKEYLKDNFIVEYKKMLEKKVIEAYSLFGTYFISFYKISKELTKKIVHDINEKEPIWEAFMEGHLFSGKLNEDIYKFMREHYEFALDFEFKDDIYREQLVQHISLGYLLNWDNLESSGLFYKIVEKFDSEDIKRIVRFFWNQKSYLKEGDEKTEQIRKRILDFWEKIYTTCEDKNLSSSQKKALSNIVKLTGFLPSLVQPYINWLKYFVVFVEDDVVFSFFLDDLEKFMKDEDRNKTAKMIGEILLNAPPFPYPEDKIKSFIEYLCETPDKKVKKIGKEICDKYMKSVKFFVKTICEKCN